jgi:hypothetical protein
MGVENNPWLTLAARIRGRRLPNARFVTGDLYRHPIDKNDVVLACLVPSMLPGLEAKFAREAQAGTLVLSARFPLPTMVAHHQSPGGAVDGVWCYTTKT